MDFFEWNKVWGALLASVLAVMVLREVGTLFYHEPSYIEGGYKIDVPENEVPVEADPTDSVETVDFASLIPTASVDAGERVAKRCLSCHNFEKGGANQTGPYLWNVLGRDIASINGFNYSSTLTGLDGVWTYDKMNGYLENPAKWAPGTKMAFAGLNRQKDRVNIIAYMRQQADTPPAVPMDAE
ncbi:MAG: c-type cytochrome [Alphaproteobacteria bacterium]